MLIVYIRKDMFYIYVKSWTLLHVCDKLDLLMASLSIYIVVVEVSAYINLAKYVVTNINSYLG